MEKEIAGTKESAGDVGFAMYEFASEPSVV
jgi:hypothetical protein